MRPCPRTWVACNEGLLTAALSNLCETRSRTWRAARDKRVAIVGAGAGGGGVNIEVRDTGPGLTPGTEAKVFELFGARRRRRTPRPRARPRDDDRIVETHGGSSASNRMPARAAVSGSACPGRIRAARDNGADQHRGPSCLPAQAWTPRMPLLACLIAGRRAPAPSAARYRLGVHDEDRAPHCPSLPGLPGSRSPLRRHVDAVAVRPGHHRLCRRARRSHAALVYARASSAGCPSCSCSRVTPRGRGRRDYTHALQQLADRDGFIVYAGGRRRPRPARGRRCARAAFWKAACAARRRGG